MAWWQVVVSSNEKVLSWWCYQMETFSILLVIYAGNSQFTGEFPSQRPVTQSFDVFFDLCLDKWLSKQLRCQCFEMLSCSLWHHCNIIHTSINQQKVNKLHAWFKKSVLYLWCIKISGMFMKNIWFFVGPFYIWDLLVYENMVKDPFMSTSF